MLTLAARTARGFKLDRLTALVDFSVTDSGNKEILK